MCVAAAAHSPKSRKRRSWTDDRPGRAAPDGACASWSRNGCESAHRVLWPPSPVRRKKREPTGLYNRRSPVRSMPARLATCCRTCRCLQTGRTHHGGAIQPLRKTVSAIFSRAGGWGISLISQWMGVEASIGSRLKSRTKNWTQPKSFAHTIISRLLTPLPRPEYYQLQFQIRG